ncbi:conserved hypothetical protein [Methylocella tundrae]|nr:conserved hypothetical protein [Methylocella tundrae]
MEAAAKPAAAKAAAMETTAKPAAVETTTTESAVAAAEGRGRTADDKRAANSSGARQCT